MNRLRQFLVGQATLVDWDYNILKESFAQLRKSDSKKLVSYDSANGCVSVWVKEQRDAKEFNWTKPFDAGRTSFVQIPTI